MSEDFEFDVDYSTSFERLEALREKMLAFVKSEPRDFLPAFDVEVVGTFAISPCCMYLHVNVLITPSNQISQPKKR